MGAYHQEVLSPKRKLKRHEPRSEVDRLKENNLYICELSGTLPAENVHRSSMWRSERDPVQQGVCYFCQLQECDSSFKHLHACNTSPPSGSAMCSARPSCFALSLCISIITHSYLHITDNIQSLSARTNDPNYCWNSFFWCGCMAFEKTLGTFQTENRTFKKGLSLRRE